MMSYMLSTDMTRAEALDVVDTYMDVDAYPFHQPGDERVVVHVEPVRFSHMG